MAPKVRITKSDIISAAIELIRRGGAEEINARNIAATLGCSTQPIFSNFSSMEELEEEVYSSAYDIYLAFLQRDAENGNYPRYKSFGMSYIRFAKEERELFKLLFMRDRSGESLKPTADFEESVRMIMNANGLSRESASLMHLELWSSVHGIATMLATSFLELDGELISRMITDMYNGLLSRHLSEGKNESNKNRRTD